MKTIITFFLPVLMALTCQPVLAQTIAVSGYVLSESSGNVISNASVFEAADGIGTISNNDGFYKLLLKPGEKSFKISDSGYQSFNKKFELKNDTTLTIHLKPMKKSDNTNLKHSEENNLRKK
jgi:hypothetical protein